MRDYELVIVVKPEVTEEEMPRIIDKVTGFVTGKGGNVIEINQWGRRRLAYPIGKYLEGNYFLTRFKFEPSQVRELETNLHFFEEVIRHLIVRVG